MDRSTLLGIIGAIAALAFVLEMVRQRRLREEYSLLWLATGAVLLLISLSRPLLESLAKLMGIFYTPNAVFVIALIFILFILMHFSIVITRLTQENKEIAQELALVRHQLAQQQSTHPQAEGSQHSDHDNDVE